MYPQIYLGATPETPQARRVLRERALDLRGRLRAEAGPSCLLLNFAPASAEPPLDLLLLRPELALAGAIYEAEEPVDVQHDGQWVARNSRTRLRGPRGETPLERVRRARDQARLRIAQLLPAAEAGLRRMPGALILAPTTPPDSRIALDVDDHRQQIKVLGLDELPGLAAMLRLDIRLDEPALHAVAEGFGGRLWHDGERLLFELAYAPLRLRLLSAPSQPPLRLVEGPNLIGRRATPLRYEYRLTLPGDDLMSSDHALLVCTLDGRAVLRDTSTNGTWVTPPGGVEERLHRADREIRPGTTLRMGVTVLRIEREE
ncbi:MAG: hypothetical protein OHK0022_32820 [Roseiflexaceae bacterium]